MTEDRSMKHQELTETVRISDPLGLHARPAARLAETAHRFSSSIVLSHHGAEADASSILDVLTLAAGPGSEITVRVCGPDAEAALENIRMFFGDSGK